MPVRLVLAQLHACYLLNEINASSAACLLFWFYLMSCILYILVPFNEISVHTCYFGSGKVKEVPLVLILKQDLERTRSNKCNGKT